MKDIKTNQKPLTDIDILTQFVKIYGEIQKVKDYVDSLFKGFLVISVINIIVFALITYQLATIKG
jgi:hypothetical protein